MNLDNVRELADRLHFSWRHRVPQIIQTEAAECGLASLAMVFGYHGKHVDLQSLRQHYGISARGATLRTLMDIAAANEMKSRALKLDIDELNALKTPCILHWDLNHFVVLVGVKQGKVIIHDPAFGRRSLGMREVSEHFTGVALELWPDNGFTSEKPRVRLNLRKMMGNVSGLIPALTKIFCLSLMIESVNLLLPVGMQLVMDHVIPAKDPDLLTLICLGLLFFIIFRTGVSMLRA